MWREPILLSFTLLVISALGFVVKAEELEWTDDSTSGPALNPFRKPESKFYDDVTMKLWVSFILRDNLIGLFEGIHNMSLEDMNIDQANEYLYEAFKYRRIDTFPLLKIARCLLNQDQLHQVDVALIMISEYAYKYIRCSVEVVKEAVVSSVVSIPDEHWDLTHDLTEYGPDLLKTIAKPANYTIRPNSTSAILMNVWNDISSGYLPPQRLVGMILLNTPSSLPALPDLLYLGSFLYLEKISAGNWVKLLNMIDHTMHPSLMSYLKTIIELIPDYLSPVTNFNISPTKYVDNPPTDKESFKQSVDNLAKNIVVYKPISSGSRQNMGKTKRTLDYLARPEFPGNFIPMARLRRSLTTVIETTKPENPSPFIKPFSQIYSYS